MSIVTGALMGFFIWSGSTALGGGFISPASAPVIIETHSVRLTGYNAVSAQTDGDPHITASGARSNPAVIAARSRDLAELLPYGTIISLGAPKDAHSCGFSEVEHFIGYRVIADSMHSRKQSQVDILFDMKDSILLGGKSINPAIAVGVCEVSFQVVGKIAVKDIPATQAELALLVK